ncbi:hypothetical protein DFR70_13123 [Nocardia tenerifensis]|uniref:Secreted protein n=1 Tax=Nocardia tenerifensis TaxID=228006 RepID=A0A318JRZ2_9NOCA|nr:hypothetical protein [Nocardia tenerifensis]PXX52702.1 hypothetical protein DFR70_13123 [Nocardia tenerifensis]
MSVRVPAVVLLSGLMVAAGVVTGGAAQAMDRPCGRGGSDSGKGSLGTPWTLKSMYDDDGPAPNRLVAGEEFEIATTGAGQHWSVTFADNGTPFFTNDDDVSTATGIREVHPNPVTRIPNHMTVHAIRHETGEVIDGAVDLPAPPPRCG